MVFGTGLFKGDARLWSDLRGDGRRAFGEVKFGTAFGRVEDVVFEAR